MSFQNVIAHLNDAANHYRASALVAKDTTEAGGLENLVIEHDLAIRKLSDGQACATDCDGRPLVQRGGGV